MNLSMDPERLVKLARVALDFRTVEPEAFAALRAIRAQEADWCQVTTAIAESLAVAPRVNGSERMPFGKYKGTRLAEIAEDDPDYLVWVLSNCANIRPRLREQITRALSAYA